MTDIEWRWPDSPTNARDVIAMHFRNWGRQLAYDVADTLLVQLASNGYFVIDHDPFATESAEGMG